MECNHHLAVLGIVLSWVAAGQGQTITETATNGNVVVGVFTSATDGGASFLVPVTTLSQGAVPSSSTNSSAPAATTSSSDADIDDPTNPHVSSSVAMIAGSLAGFIAIVAAVLVFFVARRRKRNRRRTLHAALHHSYAGAAARARHGDGDDDESLPDDDGPGVFTERDPRRLSSIHSLPRTPGRRATSSSSSSSKSRSKSGAKARQHGVNKLNFDDVELVHRTSTSLSVSSPPSSPSAALHAQATSVLAAPQGVPMIVVTNTPLSGSAVPSRAASRSPNEPTWSPSLGAPSHQTHSRRASGSSMGLTSLSGSSAPRSSISRATTPTSPLSSNTSPQLEKEQEAGSQIAGQEPLLVEDDLPPAYDDVR